MVFEIVMAGHIGIMSAIVNDLKFETCGKSNKISAARLTLTAAHSLVSVAIS